MEITQQLSKQKCSNHCQGYLARANIYLRIRHPPISLELELVDSARDPAVGASLGLFTDDTTPTNWQIEMSQLKVSFAHSTMLLLIPIKRCY